MTNTAQQGPGAAAAGSTGSGRRRVFVALAVLMVAGLVAGLLIALTSSTQAPAAATPFDYIVAEATALHDDPSAIVAFVTNEVALDDYQGELRGAVGTLWAMSGDAIDRAVLLEALLVAAHQTARLVSGATYGVEVKEHGAFTYVGPNAASDPGAQTVVAVPAAEEHVLQISVRTTTPGGQVIDEPAGSYPTAGLSAHDILLSYVSRGGKVLLQVAGPGATVTTAADASKAVSQSLVLTVSGPGETVAPVSREPFTTAFSDYVSLFDPSNRYDVTVTTGWVPDSVRRHEIGAVSPLLPDANSPAGEDAVDHTVTYSFLSQSDANIEAAATSLGVHPHFVSPRITIVANEGDHASGARDVSIDLRQDLLAADGPPQVADQINTIHSLYDSSLESAVLQDVTGATVMSAATSLAGALASATNTVGSRLSILVNALHRLLTDPLQDGASFAVAPSSSSSDFVEFTRQGPALVASASKGVRSALVHSTDPEVTWLDSGPTIASGDLARAALDTEIVLADAVHLPIDWTPAYRFSPSPRWYTDFTAISPTGDPTQNVSVSVGESGVTVALPGHQTGNTGNQGQKGSANTVTVTPADLDNATTYQFWWPGSAFTTDGSTIGMISRKVFGEIMAKNYTGYAPVTYRYSDGSLSAPLKLYGASSYYLTPDVNGVRVKLPILTIAGGFAASHLPRLDPRSVPEIMDPTDTNAGEINSFDVVDDPEFPLMLPRLSGTDAIQSDVPGTVTDAVTGQGIAGATVSLSGPGVSATSWPGGNFDLQAFAQPFGDENVVVQAPGYQQLTTTVDLTKPGSLPIQLQLQPAPPPASAAWVDSANEDSVLPTLGLSDRSQSLIRAAVAADSYVSALVPAQHTGDQLEPLDAWLQVDWRTGEMFPMFPDGLYGASTLRDLTGKAAGVISGLGHKGLGWVGGRAQDFVDGLIGNPYDEGQAVVGGPISFFAGHIAGWYLFAAGALTGVSANIANPSITLCQLHQIAVITAVALVKGGWTPTGSGIGLETALEGAGFPPQPFANGQLYEGAMKTGALLAIAELALLTKHEWGLEGTSC